MIHRTTRQGRTRYGYGPGARRPLAAVALLVLGLVATGCAHTSDAPQDLGRVPIPTAPASPVVPTASPGHAQLVAMGDAVGVSTGSDQAQITAAGPDLRLPSTASGRPPASAPGTITVTVHPVSGTTTLRADDLTITDELGHSVHFTSDRPTADASQGQAAVLHLAATYAAGHSTITWKPAGKPLVTWDFEVELD
ncbi:hypothetical protein ABZ746_05775 [Streptomyces sp. NPDC020096]